LIQIPPSAIVQWGSAAVFANVLLTRLGVPLPSAPLLVFAGSAVASGRLSFAHVLFAANGSKRLCRRWRTTSPLN